MAHTRTWNAAYEASPANAQDASLGATRIRELKLDVRERLALDHVMDETNDDGYHKQVTLEEQGAAPGNLTDKLRLYALDVGGVTELHCKDSAGNAFRITDAGKLLLLGTNNSWTKGQATTEVALTFAASLTPNASLSNAFSCTVTGDFTLEPPSNPKSGQVITIRFGYTGSGHVMTFGTTIYGNPNNDWALTAVAGKQDILVLYYNGGNNRWHALALHKDVNNAL